MMATYWMFQRAIKAAVGRPYHRSSVCSSRHRLSCFYLKPQKKNDETTFVLLLKCSCWSAGGSTFVNIYKLRENAWTELGLMSYTGTSHQGQELLLAIYIFHQWLSSQIQLNVRMNLVKLSGLSIMLYHSLAYMLTVCEIVRTLHL